MKKTLVTLLTLISLTGIFCINISGSQSGEWIPANNPHNLIGDVSVPSGMTLTIHPGVVVQAMGNFQINVLGGLIAVGTQEDSIYFRNAQVPPTTIWKGIRLESSVPATFQHCYIEYADYGINSINTQMEVSNCHFKYNKKGMQLYAMGSTTPQIMNVHHNLIELSQQNGILIAQNSNAHVHNNEVRFNGTGTAFYAAIQLSNQSASGANNPVIEYNNIHHNYKQGISAWDVASAGAINPTITNNSIEYNYTGIYLLQAGGYIANNSICNNFIPNDMNSGAGVMVSGATSVPYFEDNLITGNYTGFYITNNARPCLGDLSIYHAWAQGGNIIRDNIDANGILHSVYCDAYPTSTNVIKAENNNWGVNSADQIAIGINDNSDNPALPTVDFDPWIIEVVDSQIQGSYSYNGVHNIQSIILELVDSESAEILEQHLITTSPFTVVTEITDASFYAILKATTEIDGQFLYGCGGGIETPVVYGDIGTEFIILDEIEISDAVPYYYEKVGAPEIENMHEVFPIYKGFFLYHWDTVDFIYSAGDYYYILQHMFNTENGFSVVFFAEGTIYGKHQNMGETDSWQQTEVIGGEIHVNNMYFQRMWDGFGDNSYDVFIKKDLSGSVISKQKSSDSDSELTLYADSYMVERYKIHRLGSEVYLTEGNILVYEPLPLIQHPNNLMVRAINNITSQTYEEYVLSWHAPAYEGHEYTHYRLYVLGGNPPTVSVVAEIPFDQMDFYLANNQAGSSGYLWVKACVGDYESEPSNEVYFMTTANEDEVLAPPSISTYPNPMSLRQNQELTVKFNGYQSSKHDLAIYNAKGQRVYSTQLEDKEMFTWNGRDDKGTLCSTGIYFLKVDSAKKESFVKKFIILK